MATITPADQFLNELRTKRQSTAVDGSTSNPRIWAKVSKDEAREALLHRMPNDFIVPRVTKSGIPVVDPTNPCLASALGHSVTPHLNSHSILPDLNDLVSSGHIRFLRARVVKCDPETGKTTYHKAKIYAKTTDRSSRTISRVSKGRRIFKQTVLDIVPTPLGLKWDKETNDLGLTPGSAKWIAYKLGIDTSNVSKYGALRGLLSLLHKEGKIKAINDGEPSCVPRVYYKE